MAQVKVKWGKQLLELAVDLGSSVGALKEQLLRLTSVPVERQKLMGLKAARPIDDNTTLVEAGVTAGKTLMLLGTADDAVKPVKQALDTKESTTPHAAVHQHTGIVPIGLQNIANTCYMNAAVQMLRLAPEVYELLSSHESDPLVRELMRLYKLMESQSEAISPTSLWTTLISQYRTFGELNDKGQPMQHDAQEVLSAFLQRINSSMPETHKTMFTGKLTQTMVCKEDPDAQPTSQEVPFLMLSCNINTEIQTLEAGLEAAFNETLAINSEKLSREAMHSRTSRIAMLPEYLFVHMVRFSWRTDINGKVKVLKPVTFPMTLDLNMLCVEELKKELAPERARVLKRRDAEIERRRALRQKTQLEGETKPNERGEEDTGAAESPAGGAVGNVSGYYELCGVISHKGRSADSGHYVFWGKYAEQWMVVDDNHVACVTEEDVRRLRGSGEAHIAYVLMYRSKDPRTKRSIVPS
ncbi:unnamed protein product [Trypanosoma congolense IL3000]|uniref:Ubiquitin carboxyl-terminal hydrolase n=1 Tax=Trypanosoma congolense (strain IL3000) TaxID=1068625 RepID=F9W493_TRYCI|nr:unnamed protein product [Trypanosoma congolense IL3000]